jgi:hypothetical protein
VRIERSLRARALGYRYDETRVEQITLKTKGADGLPEHIPAKKTTVTHKELPPDVTAGMYWMNNRARGRWQNTQKVDGTIKHEHDHTHKLDLTQYTTEELQNLRNLTMKGQTRDLPSSTEENSAPGPGSTAREGARLLRRHA